MRARLSLAFGLVALLAVGAFVVFRTVSIGDLAQDDLREQLRRDARVVAEVLAAAPAGRPVTAADLAPFASPDRLVRVSGPGAATQVEAAGPGWPGTGAIGGSAVVGEFRVSVSAPERDVDDAVTAALPSLLALGGVLVVLAAVAGSLIAAWLSRPFAQLAGAADALARGRSDLRLPRSRMPEVRAIGVALSSAAAQRGDALRRERDLALRASHELRTPLTGLRLVLHELSGRDDAPADLREAADLAAGHVDRLDRAVDSVLEETRSHPVLPSAQLPLALVVPALAQRWADTLALAGVPLEAELLGDQAAPVTPGPVEQLLDEVLQAVLAHRARSVRLVVDGSERHVRTTVCVEDPAVPALPSTAALDRARAVAETVGGRMSGDLADPSGLVVVLPRR